VTSETNDSSAPDQSAARDEPDVDPAGAGSAPPTAPVQVAEEAEQQTAEGDGDQRALPTQESPLLSPAQDVPPPPAGQDVPPPSAGQDVPPPDPAGQEPPARELSAGEPTAQQPAVPDAPAPESVPGAPAAQPPFPEPPAPQVPPPWRRPLRDTAQLDPLPPEAPPRGFPSQGPPPPPSAQQHPWAQQPPWAQLSQPGPSQPEPSWPGSFPLDSVPLGPTPQPPETQSVPLGRSAEPVYHTSSVYGGGKHAQRPPKRRRSVAAAVTGGVVAVVVIALVLLLTVFKSGGSAPKYGLVATGGSAQADAQQVATAFLTAWQANDLTQAANYTDQPAAAQTGLAAYARDLNLGKFSATASGVATAAGSTSAQPRETVTLAIRASVASGTGKNALRATWAYHSTLVAYQQAQSSVWFVAWRPDVVAPNLTAATHLAAVEVAPTVSMVTDASGQNLKKYNDPGLNTIASLMASSAPTNEGANPGLDVQIETASGAPVAGMQAPLVAPGNYPTLSTTINARAEAAARAAVAQHQGSSMVAIQPSTGQILAIANNAGFNDFALTAAVAPGSTMKIITSTYLFNSGLATANTPVACPPVEVVQGVSYHNDAGESEPPTTPLSYDFAQSCNNAFDQWWPHLYGKLASTAHDYYGLNQNWNIGIGNLSASYFHAPPTASGSELAEEAFGEGQLQASPLAMASVAATVASGTFRQPILTPNAKQVTAEPLPAATDAGLKQMMRDVVTQGTGAGLGLGPSVYAKTGTADIVGQQQPNSWFVAFDSAKDVAVAFLVVNAGYGAQVSGPEATSFLNSY
jgi:hypothetical protein